VHNRLFFYCSLKGWAGQSCLGYNNKNAHINNNTVSCRKCPYSFLVPTHYDPATACSGVDFTKDRISSMVNCRIICSPSLCRSSLHSMYRATNASYSSSEWHNCSPPDDGMSLHIFGGTSQYFFVCDDIQWYCPYSLCSYASKRTLFTNDVSEMAFMLWIVMKHLLSDEL
jgi:hypothetical protein